MDVFSRYAPFIQDYIYENDWRSLRAIQMAAGDALFNTDSHVLLCASTASGKTEAAFFPILTDLWERPPASVGCLYIAPLKALINDQFERLTGLCQEGGIPVWHWHGDVSASHKRKLAKHPSGVLQITPESLEALLLRRHGDIPRLFGDLRYVVIDEIHSLMRGDRGGQTMCLIQRLSRLAGVDPRRVGLSATIGDPQACGRFLAAGSTRSTVIPHAKAPAQHWRISMAHFYNRDPQAAQETQEPPRLAVLEVPDAPAPSSGIEADVPAEAAHPAAVFDPALGYIYEHTRGRKCLVFCNSREECEAVTSTLHRYCEAKGEPDRFLIHHGNLSTAYRQTAEDAMKAEDLAMTTCTTATLELGIDIGRLERAFQIDAPFTVSAFLQRMGRTGRRGAPAEMWFVMREEHAEARALAPETIPWNLLQGIALVQLYLEERWVEPPREGRLPYSLLYHQTMAVLASEGEMTPAQLAGRVLTLAPFKNIEPEDYRLLLTDLLENDQLERTETGGLIVGLADERVVNSWKFYATFKENEEYSVRCESHEIGTIVRPPAIGGKIAIAGRVWVVEEVDRKRHLVYCHMVRGRVPAYFGDVPGDIHTHILERMRRVLQEDALYAYLQPNARARLTQLRQEARQAGCDRLPLIALGAPEDPEGIGTPAAGQGKAQMYALFPWLGSYAFLALERFIKIRLAPILELKGIDSTRPYVIQFTMRATPREFFTVLFDQAAKPIDPMDLVYPKEVPVFDKYDDILPAELVRKGFARGVLDINGMLARIAEWKELTGLSDPLFLEP
jgi:ATP-dependent Lhr-like helicase